ncbi:unnamed protein product [Mucor hiemalis]
MAESISLEETNALREKLGLPPLALEGSGEDIVNPEKDAYDNYQKMKQEADKASKDEKSEKTLKTKLQGKGLGEASDEEDEDSALNWIKKVENVKETWQHDELRN